MVDIEVDIFSAAVALLLAADLVTWVIEVLVVACAALVRMGLTADVVGRATDSIKHFLNTALVLVLLAAI